MSETVQADFTQVRRTILAAAHEAAVRSGDEKEIAKVLKDIQAEYAEDVKAV